MNANAATRDGAGVQKLLKLREDLASGQVNTIQGLRDLRTSFGDTLEVGDRTVRNAAKELWGPLSDDITNGLTKAGKADAAVAYRKADDVFKSNQASRELVEDILAGDSAETVGQKLINLSRNDGVRFGKALDLMHPDQAGEVRGAIIHNLGMAGDGAQNAAGDVFSPNVWATNWSKMSPDAKGVFKGQVRADLDDLASVIEGVKGSGRMRNTSHTAGALNVIMKIIRVAEVVGQTASVATGHGIASGAASLALGRAMVSPGVARAIVGRAKGRPSEWFANRLNGIAARSTPAIAETLRAMIAADNPRHDIPDNEVAPWESFDIPADSGERCCRR